MKNASQADEPSPKKTTVNFSFNDQHLLEEYRVNVELWKHDDMLRQERVKTFLTVNTALIVALSAFLQLQNNSTPDKTIRSSTWAIIILAATGLVASFIWHNILSRNAEYIRFRRIQLRAIEKHLNNHKTFISMHHVLNKKMELEFPVLDNEKFTPKHSRFKYSSTATEGSLPILAAIFWIIILILRISGVL